jgi:Protein kinase domain.
MSLLSDYQVIHAIGSGSFGTCYKVRHKHTNKYFVWKVIDYGDMSEEKKKVRLPKLLSKWRSCIWVQIKVIMQKSRSWKRKAPFCI